MTIADEIADLVKKVKRDDSPTPDLKTELAMARAENALLKSALARTGVSLKVSEKGAVSVYGLGRFPVTLYVQQWETLLERADEIRAFIRKNSALLRKRR